MVGEASLVPMSSGANGLVLGQLTGTPGMSPSAAGSGHGSPRRDQFTAAAMAHSVKASRKIADNPTKDSFRLERRRLAGMPAGGRRSIETLANPAPNSGTHSVFLKTA